MFKTKWIFLIYKIPREPSSKRVYIWRKLKKLGAAALQDAVFTLPFSEKNLEQFQWLAAEINEINGEAAVWECYPTTKSQESALINKFNEISNTEYSAIIQSLEKIDSVTDIDEKERILRNAVTEYMETKYNDYFVADLGSKIEEIIAKERKLLNKRRYGKEENCE